MISIDNRDPRPLYEQVVAGFRQLIVAGAMAPDEQLPSVRSMASQLAINPNTIQRAYRELEAQGFVYSVPGKGSFVASSIETATLHRRELLARLDELVDELVRMGCTREELMEHLKEGEER